MRTLEFSDLEKLRDLGASRICQKSVDEGVINFEIEFYPKQIGYEGDPNLKNFSDLNSRKSQVDDFEKELDNIANMIAH